MSRPLAIGPALLALVTAFHAGAQVPDTLGYEGFLEDDAGPVDGEFVMEVRFFDGPSSDAARLWGPEIHDDVVVEVGAFSLSIGSIEPLEPADLAADEVYVEFLVGDETLPRILVESVPYALHAARASEVEWSDVRGIPEGLDDDVLAGLSCETGDVARWDDENGMWECGQVADAFDPDSLLHADGSTPLKGVWDTAGHQLLNIVIENASQAEAPVSPTAGQLWWDTDTQGLNVFDGELWVELGGSPTAEDIEALGFVTGSHSTAPTAEDIEALGFVTGSHSAAPTVEDIEALGFVAGSPDLTPFLRADGTVPLAGDLDVSQNQLRNLVVHRAGSDSSPPDPQPGQLWWDTDSVQLLVYDGAFWIPTASRDPVGIPTLIRGPVDLRNDVDLSLVSDATRIDGQLQIFAPGPGELVLEHLESIGGTLRVSGLGGVRLPALRSIGGSLLVSGEIDDLQLPLLETIGEALQVKDLTNLARFELPSLRTVGGGADRVGNYQFLIENNSRLATVVFGLLESVGGDAAIHYNPALSVLAVGSLASIGDGESRYLQIMTNPGYPECEAVLIGLQVGLDVENASEFFSTGNNADALCD